MPDIGKEKANVKDVLTLNDWDVVIKAMEDKKIR